MPGSGRGAGTTFGASWAAGAGRGMGSSERERVGASIGRSGLAPEATKDGDYSSAAAAAAYERKNAMLRALHFERQQRRTAAEFAAATLQSPSPEPTRGGAALAFQGALAGQLSTGVQPGQQPGVGTSGSGMNSLVDGDDDSDDDMGQGAANTGVAFGWQVRAKRRHNPAPWSIVGGSPGCHDNGL